VRTRPVELADAPRIAALQAANRAFLAPWDAVRPDVFYTTAGQEVEVQRAIDLREAGRGLAHAILDDDGEVVGVIRLNNLVRGAFESGTTGYWIAEEANGRGFATEAVASILAVAFGELGLHRVEAATLVRNARSQRVLEKNGFTRIGLAPGYIRIAGEWQDHVLFQRLAPGSVSR